MDQGNHAASGTGISRVNFNWSGIFFIPDLIFYGEILKRITNITKSYLVQPNVSDKSERIIFGTVEGDIHNIPKDIVVFMLETNGFEGIDLGVYAVSSRGGSGGEMFSFNAEYGYMIRNGKKAEMVRDVSVSGNLFETMKQIDRIGNDFSIHDSAGGCGRGAQMPLPVSHSSPSFRISEATVGGA